MKHLLCFAVLTTLVCLTRSVLAEGTLDIYWIDVEGGAATLIVTPAGETILIDTGNPGRRDPDRIVQAVTKQAGKRQIDHLIITHYHRDHYGGAETLAAMLPIVSMYDNGMFDGMPDNPGKAYFELKTEKRLVINPGDKLRLKQAEGDSSLPVRLTCLGTRKSFIDAPDGVEDNADLCASGREKDRDGSDNANSVVTVLDFGPFRFLDAGDLTWNQEARLVCPKNLIGQVDVYQVTHHGLDSSNNPLVVRTVRPRVAIMNNGSTKGCLPEVFETLTSTKSIEAIYQVHKNLRRDGATNNVPDEFIANREAECQGNFIKLSVAADGKSYTVSIPANDHTKTYETKAKD
jgi:beta-lactamase superfamily II metal-dependent hydrolase